jgi:Flp pilus assembly CpaE family ATPase
MSTVQEISQAIERLDVRDQMRLLHDLPAHLKIQPDDVGWLKATEPTFEFWNNSEDAIYDQL